MKYFSLWVGHIILVLLLILGTAKFIQSDPNKKLTTIDVTVVNTIQENNEDSTSYYGVFELPNGKMISRKINRVTYGSTSAGDTGTLNLNRYDTGEAERDIPRTIVEVLMLLCTFGYSIFFTIELVNYKHKNNNRDY